MADDRTGPALRRRRRIGHAPRELAALTLVHTHEGCSVEWLRARVGLTQSGTVRLVDRLAARGLLVRGDPAGRGMPLRVTAAAVPFWSGGGRRVTTSSKAYSKECRLVSGEPLWTGWRPHCSPSAGAASKPT